jgi:nucleoid DNA-binding protein
VGKHNDKRDIIRTIVLETGYATEDVEKVVNSFISIFQDKASDGRVYIEGFGEMYAYLERKKFYNINLRAMDETIQPTVRFKPSLSFLRLVRHSQKNQEDTEEESA